MTDSYGTKFAETETLLAALSGDSREVVRRVSEMYPNERRELDQACGLVSVVCTLLESNDPESLQNGLD